MDDFVSDNKEINLGYLIGKSLFYMERYKIVLMRFFDRRNSTEKVILVVDIKKVKQQTYSNNFLFTCYVIKDNQAEIAIYTESNLLEMDADMSFEPSYLVNLFPTVNFPNLN